MLHMARVGSSACVLVVLTLHQQRSRLRLVITCLGQALQISVKLAVVEPAHAERRCMMAAHSSCCILGGLPLLSNHNPC